jgi:predicted metal-binding membrane protein
MSLQMQAMADSVPSWQWTPGAVFATFLMWAVMMVAMMLPTALPFIRTYWQLAGARRAGASRTSGTIAFVFGYLVAWTVFSAAATLLQILLHQRGLLSPNMAISGTALSGVVALGAGIYQFTPMKLACAHKCRTPIGFFVARWRDGPGGAIAVGIEHGAYCVGCCWMLMATMFVAGIMSLAWMAILTAIMLIEKLPSIGERFGRAMGWIGIAAGITLIAKSLAL